MTARECEECGGPSRIVDVRPQNDGAVKRRKECEDCGYRWNTYEVSAARYEQTQRYEDVLSDLATTAGEALGWGVVEETTESEKSDVT